MTGRVRRLANGDAMGCIQTEGGFNLSFDLSAVAAYDRDHLTVGQMVTFDIDNGIHPCAVNVLQMASPHAAPPGQRRHEPSCLRYMGFEHSGRTRIFRFERMVAGEVSRVFLVAADVDLFAKHHIGLQEGPALCLQMLTEDSATLAQNCSKFRYSLSDSDMLAHTARQPAHRKSAQPGPWRPSASSRRAV